MSAVPVLCRCPCCAKMENTAFEGDIDKSNLELKDVKVKSNSNGPRHNCEPDVCRALHVQYLQDKTKMAASPWDHLKTVFLVGIIALLILWVIFYVSLSKMDLI